MQPEQYPEQPDGPDPMRAIDDAMAGLDGLAEQPVAEHVARFDAVHVALTDALSSVDKV